MRHHVPAPTTADSVPPSETAGTGTGRAALRADCSQCAALCCVAPAFTASADFAVDKPAGQPCGNLLADFRCGIHSELQDRGFPGCTTFDCFGAGQQTVQVTFGNTDWRREPDAATAMYTVFGVLRQLHEVLWYLEESRELLPTGALREEVEQLRSQVVAATSAGPDELAATDAAAHRAAAGPLLDRVSHEVRHKDNTGRAGDRRRADRGGRARKDRRGADLIGADLRRTELRRTSLRGSYLLGADLRGTDLYRTDLLGADMRAADVRGADLGDSIFLTQPQLNAARGDSTTTVPPALIHPPHWPT